MTSEQLQTLHQDTGQLRYPHASTTFTPSRQFLGILTILSHSHIMLSSIMSITLVLICTLLSIYQCISYAGIFRYTFPIFLAILVY